MFARFLLFSGNWEGEGNFYLLESDDSIILLSIGKSIYSHSIDNGEEYEYQKIGIDYLRENSSKLKAIIISNTSFQNSELLINLFDSLNRNDIPIYVSYYAKMFFLHFFPEKITKMMVIANTNETLILDVFSINFFLLGSWFIGNFALSVNFSKYTFYIFDSFIFNSVFESNIIFPENYIIKLREFLIPKNENVYLVADCQSMHWQNKNSLFFVFQNLFSSDKDDLNLFIFYDFDWLHILELLRIAKNKKREIVIVDNSFYNLIDFFIKGNSDDFSNVIIKNINDNSKLNSSNIENYLLVGNPRNIENKIRDFFSNFEDEKLNNFHFIIATPPFIGGEYVLARTLDYLFSKSKKVTNLSKKECLSLGISFFDFKMLIRILNPENIITIQNSYRNSKFFQQLSPSYKEKFLMIDNGYALDLFEEKKLQLGKKSKSIITIEELLIKQREKLGQSGLIVLVIIIDWGENGIVLKKVRIENISAVFHLKKTKIEDVVKKWWPRIVYGMKKEVIEIVYKKKCEKIIKKKLTLLLIEYFSSKLNIGLEEVLILIF